MKGDQLREIRVELGLTLAEFGRALSYQGSKDDVARHVRRLEKGIRKVPRAIERLAFMFLCHGVPEPWRRP